MTMMQRTQPIPFMGTWSNERSQPAVVVGRRDFPHAPSFDVLSGESLDQQAVLDLLRRTVESFVAQRVELMYVAAAPHYYGGAVGHSPVSSPSEPIDQSIPDHRLMDELEEIRQTASVENWDYEDAPALDPEVFEHAEKFIQMLPAHRIIERPTISPTPQGEILFSWDSGTVDDLFDVIVYPSGQIAIAGIFGEIRVHGDVAWDNKSINRVVDLVQWADP